MIHLGSLFTGIIIVIGLAFIMPMYYQKYPQQFGLYTQQPTESQKPSALKQSVISVSNNRVMLAFSILDKSNLPQWCHELLLMSQKHDLKITIFIPGEIAEKYSECLTIFSSNRNKTDIGSQTYDYANLTSLPDYLEQLSEVQKGKQAVDNAAKINSSLFKAPYGSTDQNIYSLLTRSGIIADFSYTNQYNLYENGQFIRYDLKAYNGSNTTGLVDNIVSSKGNEPILINFDNSISVEDIENFISTLKAGSKGIDFISASEVTGIILTKYN